MALISGQASFTIPRGPSLIIVCGSFDDKGGKPSKYMAKIIDAFMFSTKFLSIDVINGGTLVDIDKAFDRAYSANVILWFANIVGENDRLKERFNLLKENNQSAILFISKNNLDNRYSEIHLIGRCLKAHAQRLLEITADNKLYSRKLFIARLFDPLGNIYGGYNGRINNSTDVGRLLSKHIDNLLNITRIRSKSIGEHKIVSHSDDINRFCELSRVVGIRLHQVMQTEFNSHRFFGNVSFRCENGFPAINNDGLIYVSPRNVNKQELMADQFIACEIDSSFVRYYGSRKPSIDAPIQIELFKKHPELKFMLHGHAYLNGAPFTEKILPCGAIEEVNEIEEIIKINTTNDIHVVNLRGHGFLIASNNVSIMEEFFKNGIYSIKARPIPEIQP